MLDKIIQTKQQELSHFPDIAESALLPNDRDFLSIFHSFAIVAEMKAKSPSEGQIATTYSPPDIAARYEQGGASALSVLCDHTYFSGDYVHLTQARNACALPLLCKEFIIDSKQVYAARAAGASACLLIVRVLTDAQLASLKACIERLGMTAVIEVFNQEEIDRALAVSPQVLGINNRDLNSLKMDTDLSMHLKNHVPDHIYCMSFSGVKTPEDIQKRRAQGFAGVLVGTALMRADDPAAFLAMARPSA